MKILIYSKNIILILFVLFLVSCSRVHNRETIFIKNEQETRRLKNEINEKNLLIKELKETIAHLKQKIDMAFGAHKELQHKYQMAIGTYNDLRAELKNQKDTHSGTSLEVDRLNDSLAYTKIQYTNALAEQRNDKQIVLALKGKLKDTVKALEHSQLELVESKNVFTLFSMNSIDDFIQSLPNGGMLFTSPETMIKGDEELVILELSPSEAINKLKIEFADRENIPVEMIKAEVFKVHDEMSATLGASSGLEVQSINEKEFLSLSNIARSIWRWKIKAIKEGEQYLYLKIGVVLTVNGKKTVRFVSDTPRVITVSVSGVRSFSGFIKKNWQFLIQILLIPLIIFVWEKFKKYRHNKKLEEDTKPKIIISE